MKEIKLTQDKVAQVDDWWFEKLNQYKWRASYAGGDWYAIRSLPRTYDKPRKTEFMHRVIMNTPPELDVDHQDHDGLNNLEENLRNCTHQQNQMNKTAAGKSKYLGVHYSNNHITAKIRLNGKTIYIGMFKTEEDAARAYDCLLYTSDAADE